MCCVRRVRLCSLVRPYLLRAIIAMSWASSQLHDPRSLTVQWNKSGSWTCEGVLPTQLALACHGRGIALLAFAGGVGWLGESSGPTARKTWV